MKREGIPVLPAKRTPRVIKKLNELMDKTYKETGLWMGWRDPGDWPERLRQIDRELFLKYNLYIQHFEVWLRPGGKQIEDNRHQPNDQYIMSCHGLSFGEIGRKLWEMSDRNKNRLTHDDVDKMEDKAHREALYGTDDDRARTRDIAEKFIVDVGVNGSKFLKGGRPSNRLI